ncbi:MAG: hypothetical protein PUP93_20350 [Rhizonema sp. NSF051]|nr:hypothetical protein [Rhizonema sp. NSF051]
MTSVQNLKYCQDLRNWHSDRSLAQGRDRYLIVQAYYSGLRQLTQAIALHLSTNVLQD